MDERRTLPALPERDRDLGELHWERWEPQIIASHLDPSCDTCAYPGPLSNAFGKTWARKTAGERTTRPPGTAEGRWIITHYAVRCPQCDETLVYLMDRQFTELRHFHQAPTTEQAVPATQDNVLF